MDEKPYRQTWSFPEDVVGTCEECGGPLVKMYGEPVCPFKTNNQAWHDDVAIYRRLLLDLRKVLREVYDSAWYVQNGEVLVCRYCDEPSFVGEEFRHKSHCTIREVKRVLRATKDFADD